MSSTSTNGNSKVNATSEDLAAQIETLRADLETLTRTMSAAISERATNAGAKARRAKDDLMDEAQVRMDELTASASSLRTDAEAAVVRNPSLSLGIATGIGFLVGLMLARR